jgi:AMP-binding enzyme
MPAWPCVPLGSGLGTDAVWAPQIVLKGVDGATRINTGCPRIHELKIKEIHALSPQGALTYIRNNQFSDGRINTSRRIPVRACQPAGQLRTLVELLESRAQAGTGRYTFLDSKGDPYCVLDYPTLSGAAERLAGILRQTCDVGSRVVLLYPAGPDFLKALFGCFFAGMVAVPLPMPEYATLKRTVARLQAVAHDADPSVILCHPSAYKLLKPHLNFEIPETSWIDSAAVLAEATGDRLTFSGTQ